MKISQNFFFKNYNFDEDLDSSFQKMNFKKQLFKGKDVFLLGKATQTFKYFL